eukprot:TRINITY_DN305_c0_g1_i1.p1 TRINITY_DN305_c0_g1~~TRINITY_DN305_c0_g1_i1.p1  ORF type:complete len:311 (+),score=70.68 TRINITY_DN305_c0_g1_i1:36-935(+)
MKITSTLFVVLLLAIGAYGFVTIERHNTTYIITPVGPVRSDCVHEVANGAIVTEVQKGSKHIVVDPATGKQTVLPKCPTIPGQPFRLGEYDGWLAYTSFQHAAGISSFLGYFSVPNAPKNDPEVLYLFTGLQNVDWIPIIDPEPTVFDIIQPVLQYPGDNGNYWSVKSWYVTLNSGVIVSREIQTTPGDKIYGNMTQTGESTWYIGGTSQKSSATSSITVTKTRLMTQPWAYNTLECYGCSGGCDYEPTSPSLFTKLELADKKGAAVTPKWIPYTSSNDVCHEHATVNSPSSVSIFFQG